MRTEIKFSVLVPVYQVEKYLEECIQSILAQTYPNWELILVNDGSTDRSGEICDRYAEKYANIRVIHKENKGILHTRRVGISNARGEYLVFLDSDDTLKQHALETIFRTIEKYDCDCVIYGMEHFLDEKVIGYSAKEDESYITDKRELYKKCIMGYYVNLGRKAARKTVFKGTEADYEPYFPIAIGEDLLQSIEIIAGSTDIAFIGDRLYRYRKNPESVMNTMTIKKQKDSLTIYQTIYEFLQKQDVLSEDDLAEFRGFFLKTIGSYVITIASSSECFAEKCRLFQEVKSLELYQSILPSGIYDKSKVAFKTKIFMELFLKKRYRVLITFCKWYLFLRKRKRTI